MASISEYYNHVEGSSALFHPVFFTPTVFSEQVEIKVQTDVTATRKTSQEDGGGIISRDQVGLVQKGFKFFA